ncbi:MAG: hypothetical protein GX890_03315 [Firmicutes bacterium]|nr:hypothetical protein [Bacillota bacterium]HPU00737.1 spore cortex biosynthesis protein YabQ [Bacillota bacterium]
MAAPALQQLIAFLEAAALGAIYAAVYDVYRSLRLQFRHLPAVLSVTADCLFWAAAAAATILFLFYRRQGEIHAYTYGGLAGGFILYFYFLSGYLLPYWRRGFAFLLRLGRRGEGAPAGPGRIFPPRRRK